MTEIAFKKLSEQIAIKNSQLILGIDPMPDQMKSEILLDIISQAEPYILGIKPNLAYFEGNRDLLTDLMHRTAEKYPQLIRILDAKRGDIAQTQKQYAHNDIKNFAPDIITVNPYMGAHDTIAPYLDADPGICVFATAASSNPDAMRFQNIMLDGRPIYDYMAQMIALCDRNRVGYVIGATRTEAVHTIRAHETGAPAWILAPGFGAQGGDLSFVKYAGANAIYPISRGLTHPEYLNGLSVRAAANQWRTAINNAAQR